MPSCRACLRSEHDIHSVFFQAENMITNWQAENMITNSDDVRIVYNHDHEGHLEISVL